MKSEQEENRRDDSLTSHSSSVEPGNANGNSLVRVNQANTLLKVNPGNTPVELKEELKEATELVLQASQASALQLGAKYLQPNKSEQTQGLVMEVHQKSDENNEFRVGMVDPSNQVNVQRIADALDVPWRKLELVKISSEEFLESFSTAYGVVFKTDGNEKNFSDNQYKWNELVEFKTENAETAKPSEEQQAPSLGETKARTEKEYAEQILRTALQLNASDVHFDMGPINGMVRLRIDGVLYSKFRTAHGEFDFSDINNRTLLKICAAIAYSAHIDYNDMLNQPQDGSLVLKYHAPNKETKETRIRFASIPRKIETGDQRGVKVTLRLNQKMITNIDELGIEKEAKQIICRGLQYIGGIGLIVGGTGSGKTNILASAHTLLRQGYGKNVMEYADTIEQMFDGICQTEVDANCPEALVIKAYLRHDPDVIIASEVRDDAATQQLVKIATAGKLVLSTLHASSLPEVFVRLKQLGVDRYSQSQTLRFVVFTSLVRRLCPKCKKQGIRLRGVESELYEYYADEKGCANCRFVGYRGRTSVTEALCISPEVADWIADESLTGAEVCAKAEKAGWLFGLNEAIGRKIAEGITSKAEVLRVIDVERRNSQHKKEETKSKFNWRDHHSKKESDEIPYEEGPVAPAPGEAEAAVENDFIDMQELDDNSFAFEVELDLDEAEVDGLVDKIGRASEDARAADNNQSEPFMMNTEAQ